MYHNYDMNLILEDLRSPEKKNFILDTDTYNEIDDQFAIAYAMFSENINLLALTAAPFKNARASTPGEGMELSYNEMVKTRDLADPEGKMGIPAYRGSADYMKNIITPVKSEAAENIVRIVKETDGIVYVAVIGAFTNVASALLLDPSIMDKMVVIMVGANSFECGNCNDFNLGQDRFAARVIFECGVPLIVLPAYGGTEKLITTNAELSFFLRDKAGQVGNFLCGLMDREEGLAENEGNVCRTRNRIIWDVAAVALLRAGDRWTSLKVVPARSITADGMWRDLNDGRSMIYAEWFNRNEIISDFYTVLRQADAK